MQFEYSLELSSTVISSTDSIMTSPLLPSGIRHTGTMYYASYAVHPAPPPGDGGSSHTPDTPTLFNELVLGGDTDLRHEGVGVHVTAGIGGGAS